jgi:hypothetical protein
LFRVGFDIHFQLWTEDTFLELLGHLKERGNFEAVESTFVVNGNIYVLRRARASS